MELMSKFYTISEIIKSLDGCDGISGAIESNLVLASILIMTIRIVLFIGTLCFFVVFEIPDNNFLRAASVLIFIDFLLRWRGLYNE